jgi:O-succinylhomoserine sulfhydrylase
MTSTDPSDCPACPDGASDAADPALPADRAGLREATLAVRGGLERTAYGETSEALFLTSGFVYEEAADAERAFLGELDRYTYTRFDNPTTATFEERLRLLEGAQAVQAVASGMSAVFVALASVVSSGARIVAARSLFGSTIVLCDEVLARWGVRTDYVDGTDLDAWRAALATPAAVVFVETPSNPMHEIIDLAAVADLAHAAGALLMVDNVFATPVLQKPLALGADVVVYSATKHIDGQGRVLGGAICGSERYVRGPVRDLVRTTGPTISPFASWVLLKGLETLPLRIRHQSASALAVATWLEGQAGVPRVRYPYLPSHPQHELARRQMTAGGSVVTFDLAVPEGATPEEAKAATYRFLDALRLVDVSNNLGDAKSLVTHPATTTHARLGATGRAAVGIGETTLRLSVGLEDPADVVDDLAAALAAL